MQNLLIFLLLNYLSESKIHSSFFNFCINSSFHQQLTCLHLKSIFTTMQKLHYILRVFLLPVTSKDKYLKDPISHHNKLRVISPSSYVKIQLTLQELAHLHCWKATQKFTVKSTYDESCKLYKVQYILGMGQISGCYLVYPTIQPDNKYQGWSLGIEKIF